MNINLYFVITKSLSKLSCQNNLKNISPSLSILFVTVDCYIHNLDQTVIFLATCNSSIGNFCFILVR